MMAMPVSVGTFNLNNLFSRFDFAADVSAAKRSTVGTKTVFTFDDPNGFKLRSYQGSLVQPRSDDGPVPGGARLPAP